MKRALFLFSEGLLIFSAVILGTLIRFQFDLEEVLDYPFLPPKTILVVLACQLCLYYFDFYDLNGTANRQELSFRLLEGLGAAAIVMALTYYLVPALIIGREILLFSFVLIGVSLYLWRLLYNRLLADKRFKERMLILGSGDMAKEIAREVINRRDARYRVVGFIDDDPELLGVSLVNPTVIANSDQMLQRANKERISRIVVALSDRRGKFPIDVLLQCRFNGIHVEEGASFYERLTGKIPVEALRPSWLIFSDGFAHSNLSLRLKGLIDVSVSLMALLLLSPLMLLVSLAIKLESRGPVLFRQERVGKDGRVFVLSKFRSMREDAEAETGPVWAEEDDPRITQVGKILRKSRIDEIPQMFSVLKGEMSFVGPRPERPFFVNQLSRQIPYYHQRHTVKPGITGWAQVNYPYGSSLEDAQEKLRYDLYYIKHISTLFDLLILFQTIKVILFGRGAR